MSDQDLSTPLAKKLKQQIEFYFSDSNYPRDKFLRAKAAENDGWIPLATIASFARMKQMTDDLGLITAVAKSCDDLVVNEDETQVKRKNPVPEKDTINERSIYVRNLPLDENVVTIESVTEKFSKHGKVNSVRLRRDPKKTFKGKAFVEYSTEEEAVKAAEDKNPEWGEGEKKVTLEVLTKKQHFEEKKQRQKEAREARKRERDENEKESKHKKKNDSFAPGLVLEVKGIPDGTERDTVKELFVTSGKVRYVDTHNLKEQGITYVRFDTAEGAKAALDNLNEGKVTLGEQKLTGRALEGDEAKKYWEEKIKPYTGPNKQGKQNRSNFGANKRARKE